MLELTVPAIRDYQVCSLFYDYRYRQNELESISAQRLMSERFHNILTRVTAFFFYKKQSGVMPSYNALLNRWERLWFPKEVDAYDIKFEQHGTVHGNLVQYSNIAAVGLLKLYEDFADHQGVPILIDERFIVPLNDEVKIAGKIDLALRRGGVNHIYTWTTERRRPSLGTLGLDFAAIKAAMDHRSPGQRNVFHVYDLGSGTPGVTLVEDQHIYTDALQFWSRQVAEATKEYEESDGSAKVFFPRRGLTTYCKGCVFDEQCAKFSFKEGL